MSPSAKQTYLFNRSGQDQTAHLENDRNSSPFFGVQSKAIKPQENDQKSAADTQLSGATTLKSNSILKIPSDVSNKVAQKTFNKNLVLSVNQTGSPVFGATRSGRVSQAATTTL